MQARYGWTDEYVVGMPYARFVQVSRVLTEALQEEQDEQYKLAAYIGWQDYYTQMMVWGKRGQPVKSFKQWLIDQGLHEPERRLTEEEEREIERYALSAGEDVLRIFRGEA